MSSSVFTERPLINESHICGDSNADLVVVYGKNGLSVDKRGLETLIEERDLSSISVIRITSPTPSMKEEEKENEKLTTGTDDDDDDDDIEEDIDEYSELNTNNNENNIRENSDRTRLKSDNEPEIVGLTIEQFYPLEEAKKLAQEILNYAGVNNNNPLEVNIDYEFQRYVIRNDHCYTPLTSPSQSRTKLSLDSASSPTSTSSTSSLSLRKDSASPATTLNSNITTVGNLRQYSNKGKLKKGQQHQQKDLELNIKSDKHSKSLVKDGKCDERKKDTLRKSIEEEEDDEEAEEEEYSDYTESSISESEDNDRDSDLDFDVNDRNGRKKKTISKRNKKTLSKVVKKRQSSIDNSAINTSIEEDKKSNIRAKSLHESRKSTNSLLVKGNQSGVKSLQTIKAQLQQVQPQQQAMQISYHKRPQQAQQTQSQQQQQGLIRQTAPGNKTQIRSKQLSDSEKAEIQLQLLDQQNLQRNLAMQNKTIRESYRPGTKIVILKKEPKKSEGGFREISTLLGQGENNRTNLFITEIKPENSSVNNTNTRQISLSQQKVHTTTKGFTPLGIESAAKNQLPSQISIQTHTSTSELATEQLDLIDSIVKADMQKGNETMKNTINDNNIPQLVKMLESTEKAVLENQSINLPRIQVAGTSTTFTSNVEDIDISNAPLLEGAEDEIPEDIIQHVVELMEDKNLQDVIDSQVLSDVSIGQQQQSIISLENVLSQPSSSATMMSTDTFHQSPVTIQNLELTGNMNVGQRDTSNSSKEPIKIIKSDGRVITLPPIEAPTTRAKRRAQTQPVASTLTGTITGNTAQVKAVNTIKSESRRNSNEQKSISGRKRNSVSSQSTPKEDFDEETEEGDSDDDPNKLWCICRQPHNNRFMICCDICEDWFHGTCVNITKAVGREMENRGIEWTCPKCLKRDDTDLQHTMPQPQPQPQKKPIQRRITETFDKRPSEEAKNTTEVARRASIGTIKKIEKKKVEVMPQKADTVQKKIDNIGKKSGIFEVNKKGVEIQHKPTMTPQKSVQHFVIQEKSISDGQNQSKMITIVEPVESEDCIIKQEPNVTPPIISNQSLAPKNENLSCIVCKKSARPNSIYCSDICIRQHAQNALISVSKVSKSSGVAGNVVTSPLPEDKKKKGPSSFEEALAKASEPVLQNKKIERVYVYERKTGRILTGKDAPTTSNLKNWLHENPTFEVIQPGSAQALAIEKSKQKLKERSLSNPTLPTSTTSTITVVKKISEQNKSPKPILISELGVRSTTPKLQKHPQQITLKPGALSPPVSQQQHLQIKHIQKEPNSQQKSHESNQSSSNSTVTKVLKKQSSVEQKTQSMGSSNDSEPIRLNVKRTLKEQLISRLNEVKDGPKLMVEEVEKFAKNTEEEMFKLFNKDTGAKYKAKYRSLMFNIKDRKNETLFHKICSKIIEPKQLVRMSPEELASQELAQWRQNENKHQLEMIKKSELDLLSCTKSYVLKTHKGEEVIESKSVDRVSLDISIPVEDVVTILNNSSVSSTSETMLESSDNKEFNKSGLESASEYESSLNTSHSKDDNKTLKNNMNDRNKKINSKDKEREKDRERDKSKEKDRDRERHKDRDRERHHKSSGKEKHKSRKRSRSRSKERRHKSPHKEQKRDRSESSEKDKRRDSSSKKDRHDSKTSSSSISKSSKSKEKEKSTTTTQKTSKQHTSSQVPNTTGEYNLIDKILESRKTVEEAANLAQKADDNKEKTSSTHKVSSTNTPTVVGSATQGITSTTVVNSPTGVVNSGNKSSSDGLSTTNNTSTKTNEASISSVDSDQEPSSTVMIASPPEDQYAKYTSDLASVIWNGNINMIDVATFQIMIQPISGVITELDKQLPTELDVVGRISPDTVWDYIGKIRKSPNKEIVLIRLLPACLSENMAYTALYSYLDKRKRLGVVKTSSPNIKDFYIMPLNAKKILPLVLQPVENTEFFEDDTRPDLLIGIVIRIMGKRQPSTPLVTNPAKIMRKNDNSGSTHSRTTTVEKDTFTPPNSPKIFTKKKTDTKSIISVGKLPPRVCEPMDVDIPTPPAKSKLPVDEDENEPYSPGGSSDDDVENLLPSVSAANAVAASLDPGEIQRRMEEINRQIEAQKIEIAGILSTTSEHVSMDSSSGYTSRKSPPPVLTPALAGISIPSNLQEILASIKSKPESTQQPPLPPPLPVSSSTSAAPPPPPIIGSLKNEKTIVLNDDDDDDDDIEEYTPLPASAYKVTMKTTKPRTPPVSPDIAIPGLSPPRDTSSPPSTKTSLSEEVSAFFTSNSSLNNDNEINLNVRLPPSPTPITKSLASATTTPSASTSRLAQLSEEELLSMVPDDIKINEVMKPSTAEEKSHVSSVKDVDMRVLEPVAVLPQPEKTSRWEMEPPPPGLEDEFI